MLDLVQQTGPIAYAILACAGLTLFFQFVFAAVAAFGVRVPAPLWFFGPGLCQFLGYLGCAMGANQALAALAAAAPESQRSLASMGLSVCLGSMALGFAVAGLLLLTHAWFAALGHAIKVGAFPEWGVGRAALTTVVPGFLGLVQLVYVIFAHGTSPWLLGPPIALMLGAPALGIICLRVATDLDSGAAARIAAARFNVGLAWTGTVLFAAVAANIVAEAQGLLAVATARPEDVAVLVAVAEDVRGATWGVGLFAFVVAAGFSLSAGVAQMEEIEGRMGVIGAVLTGVMALCLLATHIGVVAYTRGLTELIGPLVEAAPM